jgi:hypothetical protein
MAYHWQPQQFVPDYHANTHPNSARTSNSSLPLTTDIDPASTWALPLSDANQTQTQGQGHAWPPVSPQLDLAMSFGVPQEQLLITAHHPFPEGSSSAASVRNLTCVGPVNDGAWSPHENPFAGHIMGSMQAGFYPASQVVVTSMAPTSLMPSHHMGVFSPVQPGMHTPAISDGYDAHMERRTSDHSYHSAEFFTFQEPGPIFSIPAMSTALPLPATSASSPVLVSEGHQTSYPSSPGSEDYVVVENLGDGVIAMWSSEEPSDGDIACRKPGKSPPLRRKASTSESSESSECLPNNMAGGTGVFPRNKKAKRNQGGRTPGMHLTKEGAREARDMRTLGSCWRCQMQREKVRLGRWMAVANDGSAS